MFQSLYWNIRIAFCGRDIVFEYTNKNHVKWVLKYRIFGFPCCFIWLKIFYRTFSPQDYRYCVVNNVIACVKLQYLICTHGVAIALVRDRNAHLASKTPIVISTIPFHCPAFNTDTQSCSAYSPVL